MTYTSSIIDDVAKSILDELMNELTEDPNDLYIARIKDDALKVHK